MAGLLKEGLPDRGSIETAQRSRVEASLVDMGMGRLDADGIRSAYDSLSHSLTNRWRNRIPESYPDRVTSQDLVAVPDGSSVIAINMGGTSQVTSLYTKGVYGILEQQLNIQPIDKRHTDLTTEQLVGVIGDHIMTGMNTLPAEDRKKVTAVGVSVGFHIKNVEDTQYGLGAILTESPQNWPLTDFDPQHAPNIGRLLIEDLHARYGEEVSIKRAYIAHDSKTAGHDLPLETDTESLPVSFVIGTGTGAQVNGQDLSISSITDAFVPTRVIDQMVAQGYIPLANKDAVRARLGGQRTKFHVAAAMELLDSDGLLETPGVAQQVAEVLQYKENGTILSDIVSGKIDLDGFNELRGINGRERSELTKIDYETLKIASKMALEQAGDTAGIVITAGLHLSGYTGEGKLIVPVAGSFLHKGHGVSERAEATIRTLMPKSEIMLREACDRRGAANMALKREYEKVA